MDSNNSDAMSCTNSNATSGKRGSVRKSREELNDIEKQRTKRINQHIVALRNLLEMSNIATKKDKFSVLKNTYDYIVKLRQDIGKLNRRPVVEPSMVPTSGNKDNLPSESNSICYDSLFLDAHAPMALASVDGQFLSCNEKFEQLSGYNSRDITKVSIFNCTVPEEMNQLFNVVGTLLSQPDQTAKHFWKTCKFRETIETCFVSIWLVRRKGEEASCFQMIMVPLAHCDGVWTSSGPMKTNAAPVVPTEKSNVEMWTSLQKGMMASPGGDGTMGAGGMVGMGGGIRHPEFTDDSHTQVKVEPDSMSNNDIPVTNSSSYSLAGNLTEAANSLATVQYSGGGDEEGDICWTSEDYADIFNSITSDDLQDVCGGGDEDGSDNSLEM